MAEAPGVLLLRPPIREFSARYWSPDSRAERSYPIGLAYLAAALRAHGLGVEILDAWAEPRFEKVPLPRELAYLSRLSDLNLCMEPNDYYQQGMSDAALFERLRTSRFSIVGISSMFSGYHLEALRWADAVKRARPQATVVLGGSAVTASPIQTLEHPSVDYIVLGEGERTLPKLARAILEGDPRAAAAIPGVGAKPAGRPVIALRQDFASELDELAPPAHDLIDRRPYRIAWSPSGEPYVGLFTSRGCPHYCDFCSIHLSMGRRFRAHSPERVLREIRECHDRYGVNVFNIEDDNFAFDAERAKAILRGVVREFGPRRLRFRSFNGMTALSLRDPELVSLMSLATFDHVNIALESNDLEVRRIMRKPGTVEHFARAVDSCSAQGIGVGAFSIIGLPYSDVRKDVETQLFSLGQRMTRPPAPVMFYPIPSTPLYSQCLNKGWIGPQTRLLTRLRSAAFAARRPGYSRRDAYTLFNLALLFGQFKALAPRFGGGRSRFTVAEILANHRAAHGCRLESEDGSLVLRADGPKMHACDSLFAQIELLWDRGLLTALVRRGPRWAAFRQARGSARVIKLFLDGLRGRPLRYAGGEELIFTSQASPAQAEKMPSVCACKRAVRPRSAA